MPDSVTSRVTEPLFSHDYRTLEGVFARIATTTAREKKLTFKLKNRRRAAEQAGPAHIGADV
jgi:hypothetical protein